LDQRRDRVATVTQHRLTLAERGLEHQAQALGRAGGALLTRRAQALDQVAERIAQESARRLSRAEERLDAKAERLRLVDPARLLERGYAMLRMSSGAFLMSVRDAPKGTAVQAHLVDGVLDLVSEGPKAQKESP
jgi:exodeoxyribonuclease VII large subunit